LRAIIGSISSNGWAADLTIDLMERAVGNIETGSIRWRCTPGAVNYDPSLAPPGAADRATSTVRCAAIRSIHPSTGASALSALSSVIPARGRAACRVQPSPRDPALDGQE
jgi:hypothetical protein